MKRIFLLLILILTVSPCWATNTPIIIGDTVSAHYAAAVTSNAATQSRCRAVWIGTTQSLDFSFDGSTWVTFAGSTAGTILPIQVVGARITSGAANPGSNDVVFLY
jgi:hypothetical protein